MRIIGFNTLKISAERKKPIDKEINISSNIEIKEISKAQIDIIKDQEAINIKFDFKIDYQPEYANILVEGLITAIVEKDEHKELMKMWKKKKIPEKIRIPLFNVILTKCSLRALQLEEELNLPFHVQLPQIRQSQNTTYTG